MPLQEIVTFSMGLLFLPRITPFTLDDCEKAAFPIQQKKKISIVFITLKEFNFYFFNF